MDMEQHYYDKVVPRHGLNKRVYIRHGEKIICYPIIHVDVHNCESSLEYDEPNPLFELTLPDWESASNLMDDLYYGEYDGA